MSMSHRALSSLVKSLPLLVVYLLNIVSNPCDSFNFDFIFKANMKLLLNVQFLTVPITHSRNADNEVDGFEQKQIKCIE